VGSTPALQHRRRFADAATCDGTVGRSFRAIALCAVLSIIAGCNSAAPPSDDLRTGYEALAASQYEQAMAAADRFLQASPSGPGAAEAMYLRGRAIEQRVKSSDAEALADLRQARKLYEQALLLRPAPLTETYLHVSLGNVCYWLEDYAAAEAEWSAAVDKLPSEDLRSLVLYRIGVCQQRLGKWALADATFAAVQRQYPSTPAASSAARQQGARQFHVQVAAFQSILSAENMVKKLRGEGFPAMRLARPEKNLHLVMVGPLPDYPRARAMKDRLVHAGYKDVMIVP